MSSQVLKPLLVTKESAPRTHYIFMQYPIEVTECWANLTAGKNIADGVVSTVGETLASSLFKLIRQAFVDDGVVAEDEITPSGLRPLRGELCSRELSKLEKIKVTALKAKHISNLAQHQSIGTIKGGHITTEKIPLNVAQEALDMVRTATKMMLAAKEDDNKEDDSCYYVRMSVLFQIDKC